MADVCCRFYTLSSSCEGLPERWQSTPVGGCNVDPNAPTATDARYRYAKCSGDSFTVEHYSDTKCQNLVSVEERSSTSCVARTEYWGVNYIQLVCNL